MDKLTKEERSRNMSAIKGRDTKPEILLRKWLFLQGYRYRNNVSYIPGHPDLFLRRYNTAVFVNGCYWHRHQGCKYAYTPKSNSEFWEKKFQANIKRDSRVRVELSSMGIKCLVIWECTIKKMKADSEHRDLMMGNIMEFFENNEEYLEL